MNETESRRHLSERAIEEALYVLRESRHFAIGLADRICQMSQDEVNYAIEICEELIESIELRDRSLPDWDLPNWHCQRLFLVLTRLRLILGAPKGSQHAIDGALLAIGEIERSIRYLTMEPDGPRLVPR